LEPPVHQGRGFLIPAGEPALQAVLQGWRVSLWFSTTTPIELAQLRGRVVLVHAFQMLCLACMEHGLPQTLRAYEAFECEPLMVIGLHAVLAHHAAMGPTVLRAFIHEYWLSLPIGVDEAALRAGAVRVTTARSGAARHAQRPALRPAWAPTAEHFRGLRRSGVGCRDRPAAGGIPA